MNTARRLSLFVGRLTNGKGRFESASDLPFEGLIVHAAGQGKSGFCVVDVFESEEAVKLFNETMASIPREVGIEQPRTSSPHTRSSRGSQLRNHRHPHAWPAAAIPSASARPSAPASVRGRQGTGITPETADRWLDAGALEAGGRGLPRDGNYWQAGWDWIAEERAANRPAW
jgi:hypothetical protein